MFYVSNFDKMTKKFGITDTDDGVEEYYTKEEIINNFKMFKIYGVTGSTVKVVSAANTVVKETFGKFGDVVRRLVNTYSMEECMALARSLHFVKQIKGLEDIAEVRQITYEHVYPQSVQDVVRSAAEYTNSVREIDVTDMGLVRDTLKSHMCLILQHKTNGALTAFICTGSIGLMDRIYEPYFIDKVFLTKMLYSYTANINRVRDVEQDREDRSPDLLDVFSGSLRFRETGVHRDGLDKELSSPFYTVNLPKLLAIFVLDNPAKLGNKIMPIFYDGEDKQGYNFNFQMYQEVSACITTGTNMFLDRGNFMKYVDMSTLDHTVDIDFLIERFNKKFEYMRYLRGRGCSFK